MFSKTHSTGGCGGIVYTGIRKLYERARMLADRGKPFFSDDFNPKDPRTFLLPGLNLNQSEIACAIGTSTLRRLPDVGERRRNWLAQLAEALESRATMTRVVRSSTNVLASPFFATLEVDSSRIRVSKEQFARAVMAEGIPVNPDYRYVVSEWPWARQFLEAGMATPNASLHRERTFNVLFHEAFGASELEMVVQAIVKVEMHYGIGSGL